MSAPEQAERHAGLARALFVQFHDVDGLFVVGGLIVGGLVFQIKAKRHVQLESVARVLVASRRQLHAFGKLVLFLLDELVEKFLDDRRTARIAGKEDVQRINFAPSERAVERLEKVHDAFADSRLDKRVQLLGVNVQLDADREAAAFLLLIGK